MVSDSIILNTPEQIAFFRLAQLKAVLTLELKGIRVWRTTTAYATAKRVSGLKGSRASVLAQLTKMVEDAIAAKH